MPAFYKIGEFAEKTGISVSTLRRWDKEGKLKPSRVTDGGTRLYSDYQLKTYTNSISGCSRERITVLYCRVSSSKQKDDLERQIENVKTYAYTKGYQFEVITDIGSGINYTKKGLIYLLDRVMSGDIERIIVLYKDRLIRFGYELIEHICQVNDTKIEIIDNTEKTEQEELVEDLIQIITVFSCKLQGKRVKKTRELMKSLKDGSD